MPEDKTIADQTPGFDEPGEASRTVSMIPERGQADPGATAPYVPPGDHAPQEADRKALEERILKRVERSGARVKKDPLIGRVFGDRFEILSKLGAGGMGVVYKARQRGMDRFVAIKVLLKEYHSNETAIRRFEREALAVSKLEHPNTVRIYDFGETEDGQLYIAMEFLTGAPLERLLREAGYLPVRQVLRIVQQMCRSLDEAHRKGIIHRDLKPDNVFVGAIEGQPDFVKVLDFGVAKLREQEDQGGTLTQHGTIFGTPKYMSPEQCKSEALDQRSDLYSVGVMMFEMLAGRVPFESDNPLAILIMHAQDPVRPLSEVRPDLVIPFEVEALMHGLLAKDREERPANSKAVIDACEGLLAAVPEEFEEQLTYETAERQGMDFNRSQAYTIKNRLTHLTGLQGQDKHLQLTMAVETGVAPSPWRRYMIATGALLVACVAMVAYLYTQIRPIPASAQSLIPAEWASGELPSLEPRLVSVTLSANVGNVTVSDAETGVMLGQIETADTPKTFQWLREPGRKATLALAYGASPARRLSIDLGENSVLPKVVFEQPEAGKVVPKVALTLKARPDGVMAKLSGSDQLWPIPPEGRVIRLVQEETPVEVTFSRAGYLPVTRPFVPGADGTLEVALEVDPAAKVPAQAPAMVSLIVSANVGGVELTVGETGRLYKLGAAGAPLAIELSQASEAVSLSFTRRGYKPQRRTFLPREDGSLAIVLEKKKTTHRPTAAAHSGKTPPAHTKPTSTVPKLTPIKKPEGPGKLGRIKHF